MYKVYYYFFKFNFFPIKMIFKYKKFKIIFLYI